MCIRICYCFKLVTRFIKDISMRLLRRTLQITLNQLLWTALFVIVIIIVSVNKSHNISIKLKAENPVILWWTNGFPSTSETRHCDSDIKCDVYSDRNLTQLFDVKAYLFYGSNIDFDDMPLPRKPEEIIWGLYHEESPRNVEELMHEEVLSLFNFSATFSKHSDVPFPLQHLDSTQDITSKEYFVETAEKNLHLKDISSIMYLQSDCETSTERDAYVQELMKLTDVDSYGVCLKNKEMPAKFTEDYLNNLNEDEFLKFIARYKFVIAIENGVCDDYVTEKFWRAIKVGVVPIYFGSPSIRDWLPNNKSAILLQDFPTPKILTEHLEKLNDNDELYEEYLEHKTKQLVTNERLLEEFKFRTFQMDVLKVVEKFECLVCKKIHYNIIGIREENIVDKTHYDCPKPISALTLSVNPHNDWIFSWETAEHEAKKIYDKIMTEK